MLDLLTASAWALEPRYYGMAKERILARLAEGKPALSQAEAVPRRYPHQDKAGLPTMWKAAGVPALPAPGLGAALAGAIMAGRGGRPGAKGVASGATVAVIPVQGAMQKRGGMCSQGTKDLVAMLAQANQDPEISAVVLDIDSPGGQVDGTEEFAQAIASSAKPVVAFIDGMGASAAYWVASQASSIFINSDSTAYAGSLGVLCMSVNQTAFLEKKGYQVEILRSSRAVDKARLNSVEPLDDELRAQVTAELDQVAATFISTVQAGRAGKLSAKEDVFTGKVYSGAEARRVGLVDATGSLQDAINEAARLAA
ncbi:MAG: S49 family peptidase [Janthinobacterium lividum]